MTARRQLTGRAGVHACATALAWVGLTLLGTARYAAEPARALRSAGEGSARCIPFDASNAQVVLQAKVNDRSTAWFVLDTGSMGSVLSATLADALGLATFGRQRSLGAGGEQEGSRVRGIDLAFQGFQLLDQTMDTLALEGLSAQAGRPIDGIVGHTVFERFVVEIDYARRCLSLHDPASFEYRGRGAIVPISFKESHPYVEAKVVLTGGRSIEGEFVVDTGASGALIISSEYIKRKGLIAPTGKTISVQAHGVGGGTEIRLSRTERLELAGFGLARPIAAFQPAGAGRVCAPGTVGNIGGRILGRFKVIFDYSRKRMILEPAPSFGDPFHADMTGLGISAPPPDYRRVVVKRVMNDSPASEAGVRVGDEIQSVDGVPATKIGVDGLRELFRREGRELELVLKRGGERLVLALRTRTLI